MTNRVMRAFAMTAVLSLGALRSAQAQQGAPVIDARWRAYLGCWNTFAGAMPGPMVCVVPTSTRSVVEMVSISGDSVVSRTRVDASGARAGVSRDQCDGWESATWSADERRLYTRAEYRCDEKADAQTSTGLFAFDEVSENGVASFLRVESVRVGENSRVRMVKYVAVPSMTAIPLALARQLPDVNAAPSIGARMMASGPIGYAAVVEATKAIDPAVVEVWLSERGQGFGVTARDLKRLRDAGVSDRVIDVIVATSHPKVFTVASGGAPTARRDDILAGQGAMTQQQLEMVLRQEAMRRQTGFGGINRFGFGCWDPFFSPWNASGFCDGGLIGLYGNGWGWAPGFNNVWGGNIWGPGWRNSGWLPGNSPVVVAPTPPPSAAVDPARVINGRGYSEGGSTSGRTGSSASTPRYYGGSASSGGYSGGGSSSGSASSGSGSSSAGGGERTAKPRP